MSKDICLFKVYTMLNVLNGELNNYLLYVNLNMIVNGTNSLSVDQR